MYFFTETYYEFQLLKASAYLFLNYIKSRALLMIKSRSFVWL
jgi:hypothetical protein